MDTVTLVENQIDDGQKLLNRLRAEEFVFHAACWVKPVEEDRWSLYIATPAVDEMGAAAAYRQVYRVLRSLGEVWITDSDIKLIGEKHPVAQDVLDILRRFPHRTPIRSPRPLLGGVPVEELYVYPLGKTTVTIYHLVIPGVPEILSLDPLLLDGRFSMEVESQGERKVSQGKTGIACVVAAPEGARVERNGSGEMVLAWDDLRGNRRQSSANEVWSLAKLGLHGFSFLRDPDPARPSP